jgi:leucine dehydrogenase
MSIFEHMKKNNSRELLFFEEESLALKVIVAIDSIVLGPANASAKLLNYKKEDDAIADALDIAYYNSLRAAILKRSIGGGSIILWGDPDKVKSEMYFRALGVFINRWKGKLFMTKSKGVSYKDMNYVRKETEYMLGMDESHKGLGRIYLSRAKGMIWGLKAATKHKLDTNSLKGLKVAVQGVGDLGTELVKELIKEGAELTITDKIYDRIKVIQDEVNDINIVRPEDIYDCECDIFCSCATERLISKENLKRLKCKILSGGTNEILKSEEEAEMMRKSETLYIPGYIINGGDIIQLSNEINGYGKEKMEEELSDIYYNTMDIILDSEKTNIPPCKIAVKKAEEYVKNISAIKMIK